MALDSREKRENVPGVGRPWMRAHHTEVIDRQWRIGVGLAYGGNALDAVELIPIVATAMPYTAQALQVDTTIKIVAASLTFAGQPIKVSSLVSIVAAVMPWTARALQADTTVRIVAAAMPFTAQVILVSAGERVPVVAASLAFSAQPVKLNATVRIVAPSLVYAGQNITVEQIIPTGWFNQAMLYPGKRWVGINAGKARHWREEPDSND